MEQMIEGCHRFRENQWSDFRDLYRTLAKKGQSPKAIVISCSDSRVDPQMVFGVNPGDLFVVRNVANVIPPYRPHAEYHGTSAALEFALRSLTVKHIIVLGHALCGGFVRLVRGGDPVPDDQDDFIGSWISLAAPARHRALADDPVSTDSIQRIVEREALKNSLENLMTFPWIQEAVESQDILIYAWFFNIETGELLRLNEIGGFPVSMPNCGVPSKRSH